MCFIDVCKSSSFNGFKCLSCYSSETRRSVTLVCLNILKSQKKHVGKAAISPSAQCCQNRHAWRGAGKQPIQVGGREEGRGTEASRGGGAGAGSPRMGWELSGKEDIPSWAVCVQERRADCRQVCGSPYGCGLGRVTGIAGEMGRSHPLKEFCAKDFELYLKVIWRRI